MSSETKKYLVTLEVTCDPNEVGVGNPAWWNYAHLLGKDATSVYASLVDAEEICCDEKRTWATTPADERYGDSFQPEWHEETCANYVAIEEDEDEVEDENLLNIVFGASPVVTLETLTIRGGF